MSLAAESPSPSSPSSSSGSDDFAALLDAELELTSAADSASAGDPSAATDDDEEGGDEEEEEEDVVVVVEQEDAIVEQSSTKRRRVEDQHRHQAVVMKSDEDTVGSSKDVKIDECPPHPGFFGGLCYRCGKRQDEEDVPGVAFGYIHKGLRLGTTEIDRLRGADLKNLLRERKLVLILDLDHTLINSTKLFDLSAAENELGIQSAAKEVVPDRSLFTLETMQMLTKLRPFVRRFLKEASDMFEMYIYTMGDKAYAIEIAKLLDPDNVYFGSKVISNSDCTQRHQKGLDVVLGDESVAVILDDTEYVWQKHKENLILMERYHYFASSCRQFGFGARSLSETMQDERENDGALATILFVLERIHTIFFDPDDQKPLSSRDVRQVIKRVRQEVLQGCKLVFTRVFPLHQRPQDQMLWKMAEQLGAVCCTDVDSTVTHVVALDLGTEKARWAVSNKKFLVHPRWIEAANFRWQRQQEEDFPVARPKEKGKENAADAPISKENGDKNAADAANAKKGNENVADAGSTKEGSKENADDAANSEEGSKENADDAANAEKSKSDGAASGATGS
ncbi:RNA polymerase II C-terminal domain phosphatase-like 4 isoform X1 [Oryza glaberrima]|uniref:RNA polymerase II C-terminal domain phosphatase-like n=1 Tax=Oryza glaberrima TaxID=4538 RepID=I1PVA4_ORYGL|nr:RNA polymerase II C-terminal domain phosphatase-like 4 isoform X1 [Oryza glaberrima]